MAKVGDLVPSECFENALIRDYGLTELNKMYLDSIIYCSEFQLFQTILAMYILRLEKGKLDMEFDMILCYIAELVKTRKLDETIKSWSVTVSALNHKYRNRYDDFMGIFKHYLQNLYIRSDEDNYQNFVDSLTQRFLSYGYKSKGRIRRLIKSIIRG